MDRKTLEYMEERAVKGREIVNRITELERNLSQVKSGSFQCIDIKVDSTTIRGTAWGTSKVANDYQTEFEASMLNAFIDMTKVEIQRLEQELAEL
jgi:hypothetical protein